MTASHSWLGISSTICLKESDTPQSPARRDCAIEVWITSSTFGPGLSMARVCRPTMPARIDASDTDVSG